MYISLFDRTRSPLRPEVHFTAEKGWLNDPNGLIFFHGEYHLFFQFNPYAVNWGPMHWGHAISKDLITWEDCPIALFPDQAYDLDPEGGCFSGSAIEKDGCLYLVYTGSVHSGTELRQTQNIAISHDGRTFTKYSNNPVIDISDLPMGTTREFRDPKVFKVNSIYYMVLGGSSANDGKIYLYESRDLLDWTFKSLVFSSDGRYGEMFECPDLFMLDGKWVLTYSPIKSPDGYKCVYHVGEMDFDSGTFCSGNYDAIDNGFDYYASQSFLDERGTRLSMAWQNGWPWMPWCSDWGLSVQEGWRGALSIPRELYLSGNRLCSRIAEQLGDIWKEYTILHNLYVDGSVHIATGDDNCYRLDIEFDIQKLESKVFSLSMMEGLGRAVQIDFDCLYGLVCLNKDNADTFCKGKMFSTIDIHQRHQKATIIVDHSSVEIYLDNGKVVTTNVYPCKDQHNVCISVPYKSSVIDTISISRLR